ncbi:5-formyltetrahydrofolate cyclo-ligase [Hahella sp. NBU794]|uniref:5-formyltetrahydrofolate cyclo-ligase n=1 Tax=Hahella sp. NBU794 TaxID=3422590 RepID=UPI003D6E67B3
MNKASIRRVMRKKRRALTPAQQRTAASGLRKSLNSAIHLSRSARWGLYLANDGEINPLPTIQRLWRRKKACYLPVLHPLYHNRLWFVRYQPGARLKPNKYGIPEPVLRGAKRVPPWSLDVVCFPLVAFDKQGNRLGMGGGYYDRTFADRRVIIKRPKLIGFAHHFQQLPELPHEPWDIPLSAVATDQQLHRFRNKKTLR